MNRNHSNQADCHTSFTHCPSFPFLLCYNIQGINIQIECTKSQKQRIDTMFKYVRLLVISTILMIVLAACGNKEIEPNMSSKVGDFEAITQDETPFNAEDFKGKWSVVNFVFTNCTTVCLPMSSNMSYLQGKIKEDDLDNVQLVSFSVDPEFDTPEVLQEYAKDYEADLEMWTFLTGYDFEEIREISIKSFKSMLQEPAPGEDQVGHGTRSYLVNPEGDIIKSYDGKLQDEMDQILIDLNAVK